MEQAEKTQTDEQQAVHAMEYVSEVEAELQKIFGGVLALVDTIAELRRLTSRNVPRPRRRSSTRMRTWCARFGLCHETDGINAVVDAAPGVQRPVEIEEQIVGVPVPQVFEQILAVVPIIPQERVSEHVLE